MRRVAAAIGVAERATLIEQDVHSGGSGRATRDVFENRPNPIEHHGSGELDELAGRYVVFEILEQRRYGPTRTAKYPRAIVAISIMVDC